MTCRRHAFTWIAFAASCARGYLNGVLERLGAF